MLGALCEAAERDPEIADLYHRECQGNAEVRLPGHPPTAQPVIVYRCGCPCHGDGEAGR